MIGLHARRSADAIAAWSAAHPARGLAVALTGSDRLARALDLVLAEAVLARRRSAGVH